MKSNKMVREDLLRKIEDEVLNLKNCSLSDERIKNNTFPVVGEGNRLAEIMFIGEAPGRNEAKTGRPFCGAAGKILDELLASISLEREKVYITNIVKDRPPKNRDPLPEEIKIYGPFLDRQIEIIQPKVIATLGRYSAKYIMEKTGLIDQIDLISKTHGKVYKGVTSYGLIKVVSLYHPATAIYNPRIKGVLVDDFQILKGC